MYRFTNSWPTWTTLIQLLVNPKSQPCKSSCSVGSMVLLTYIMSITFDLSAMVSFSPITSNFLASTKNCWTIMQPPLLCLNEWTNNKITVFISKCLWTYMSNRKSIYNHLQKSYIDKLLVRQLRWNVKNFHEMKI